ncbi:ADP-ribosyltransferase [Bacillus paralicheniformis]|uniref:ADP-ribosyltransferase n=1 Tax=Bacillus paralicheniformis TaxID=1648923 RepID=UPI002244B5AA|nr:ADP-ribosyltransferase [Bacillus paralicheniformis]MEC1020531.1 ADP-ribosyltransferase [Bacillus paralicheniformis]MEC1026860.1 ADP-ribosyltransferase [Bacillus paralicheniformis]MEC1036116.1 ADP-ribosyltransferase [Bacillus paralicheniformis]MEC1049151.1 ADP-ribosyltransferase [Bacillus paralicheniformis]MEC1061054.1 ADP-ribosyltransferase [Bacillus paralicheniformis]
MDVKYVPEEWQGMKDGLDALTGGQYGGGMKAGLIKLNDLLEDIESKIKDKDSDRSISFTHTSKKSKIEELFKDYKKLADFCLKAGSLVEDHIDSPFYKKIDAFAEKMRGLTIHNYTTANRIGSKETTYVGYGMSKQAVETDKAKVSVNDIFKDSESFDHVLSKEFEEFQINHPDIELSYEEYTKAIASSRGFEYESIGDVQKNQELWRDLLAGAGIIVLTIFCAPAGLTVAVAYGGANISSAATGKDWMTQRELNTGERFERGVFGALDIIPGAAAAKGSFKSVVSVGQISSKTEHVVQSLKDSKNIWANRMKVNGLKAADKLNDLGHTIKKPIAKGLDNLSSVARVTDIQGEALVQSGGNYYANVKSAYEASKSKIQDSIHKIEKGIHSGKSNSGISDVKRTLSNLDEAHQWGSKYYDHWLDSLTENEKSAIKQYTGNDYTRINNYLRGLSDSLEGVELDVIDNIKNGLKKANVPHDIQVYRGTDLRPIQDLYKIDDEGNIIAESLVGKIFKDDGFVSTAMVKESSFDHMNVSWEINIPKGAHAAYLGKISHFPNEAELLLNSGQQMIIKSAVIDSSGKMHLVLDLL